MSEREARVTQPTTDLRSAYDAALEWADRQDRWVAEQLPPDESIGAAIRASIEHHFGPLARADRPPEPPTGSTLRVPDSIKMLRETFSVAQNRINNSPFDEARKREHSDRLQRLIEECERQRPTGPDGKHNDRHTATCGCLAGSPPPPDLDKP